MTELARFARSLIKTSSMVYTVGAKIKFPFRISSTCVKCSFRNRCVVVACLLYDTVEFTPAMVP